MAKKAKKLVNLWEPGPAKKSSSSGKPCMVKFSSMNKSKKRSYKKYRGQGRQEKYMSGGNVVAMMVVFWLVSSGERNEQRQADLRAKCYQLTEVEEVYASRYECMKDNARKG